AWRPSGLDVTLRRARGDHRPRARGFPKDPEGSALDWKTDGVRPRLNRRTAPAPTRATLGEAHEGREVRNRVRSPVTDQPPRAVRRPDRTGGESFRIGLRSLRSGDSPGVGPGQKIDTLVRDSHDGRVRIGAYNPGHNGGVHYPKAVYPLDPQVGRDHGRGVFRSAHSAGADRVKVALRRRFHV